MDEATPTKYDFRYAEELIVFSLCDCSLDKRYSFWKLSDKEDAKRFRDRLACIEQLTWKQFMAYDRVDGITCEIPGSDSYKMISQQDTSGQIVDKHYYHFRVEKAGTFRVFGYQKGATFCITHIDRDGVLHHR